MPQQSRSRQRVERLLDATAQLVVTGGVESLSTRGIAEAAEIPVASLYQYFSDKDAILLALVERDIEEMDAQVAADVGALEVVSLPGIVEATMHAFVKVYLRRPAFVMIWLRGRTNQAIRDYGREHNRRVAQDLFGLASAAGMLSPETTVLQAELAVEMGDRLFQLAFEEDLTGDPRILTEAVLVVKSYIDQYSTEIGRIGIPA
jgi:AcrR family transcriptional regulator